MYQLFYNGHLHTFDVQNPVSTVLLVMNGRVVYCGKQQDINLPDYSLQKTDLRGLHVYPGFIDCHTHVAAVALKTERISLDKSHSRSAALEIIKKHVIKFKPGEWIIGGGWNSNLWSKGDPHKKYLDQITTDHPIALYNKDGHTQWLNSKALEICGFNNASSDPPGGKIGRDQNGRTTGLIYEKGCDIVNGFSEDITYDQLHRCLNHIIPQLYALGITSVHSCENMRIWSLFQELSKRKELEIRICMHPPQEAADAIIQNGLRSGYGDEWLRLGGLKYFIDGSLGSQSAEMFENFKGLDHSGIGVMSESQLTDRLFYTVENDLGATIHAIGDKANNKALNALTKVKDISKKRNLRHRIEHAQILREFDISRFADLGVIASMQPLHITDDIKIAEKYLGTRTKNAYRIASLKRAGTKVVFGSDMPTADPDPLRGIRAAFSRRYRLDENEPQWYSEECLSISDALYAYTRDAAYASYEEQLKGTLSRGKLADFFATSVDLEQASESLLSKAKIEMTVLGGKIVYRQANLSLT
jgi:predicted amidohydrolase YtcJ